jgi:hypothetical protein
MFFSNLSFGKDFSNWLTLDNSFGLPSLELIV